MFPPLDEELESPSLLGPSDRAKLSYSVTLCIRNRTKQYVITTLLYEEGNRSSFRNVVSLVLFRKQEYDQSPNIQ
jgi:hypothetical protein